MTSGAPVHSDSSMIEPWRERTQKQALLDKAHRLRERVETELFVANARDGQVRSAVRRCICDAENLILLAEQLLQTDWTDR